MAEKIKTADVIAEQLKDLKLSENAYETLLNVVQGITIGIQLAQGEA